MSWTVAELWRHPIKGIGAEALDQTDLTPNHPVPGDRAWAVLESGGEAADGWRACRNFLRGAKGEKLMAVTAITQGAKIRLSHPELAHLQITPGTPEAERDLFDWVKPIYPENRPAAAALVESPPAGMSDAPFASISILNMSSLRAVSQKAGVPLDTRRFRANIWLDGLAPWEEFDLVGKTLQIGESTLNVVERIGRCRATEANPATGRRDVPMLRLLEDGWDHTDFGVYAKVTGAGTLKVGDTATLV